MQDGILATVTSAQRTGELQAPSVHEDLGRSWPDKGVVGFHPKPAFLPMVLSKAQLTQVIGLCPLLTCRQTEYRDRVGPHSALLGALESFSVTNQLFRCLSMSAWADHCLRLDHRSESAGLQAGRSAGHSTSTIGWRPPGRCGMVRLCQRSAQQ